ncbi:hypothetical protein [Streptomyces sp. NPDC091217]|uniref:hypothetical protein n=1 Tax=Streptomyces sp. NPDC091217 TaxID=3365975 RepID=UPI0037F32C31
MAFFDITGDFDGDVAGVFGGFTGEEPSADLAPLWSFVFFVFGTRPGYDARGGIGDGSEHRLCPRWQ